MKNKNICFLLPIMGILIGCVNKPVQTISTPSPGIISPSPIPSNSIAPSIVPTLIPSQNPSPFVSASPVININRKMLFVRKNENEFPEIYSMNPDGSQEIRLTYNSVEDTEPLISPDGTEFSYNSSDGSYLMKIDGTNNRKIYPTRVSTQRSWSTDSNLLAFSNGNIMVYDKAFGSSNGLTKGGQPSFSPNGKKIAYSLDGNIFIMNNDGSGQIKITNNSLKGLGRTSWSPLGDKIYFTWDKGEIYSLNIDGSNFRKITDVFVYSFDISSDGSKIIYNTDMENNSYIMTIFKVNSDGANKVELTRGKTPLWSPDGSKILYEGEIDQKSGICKMNQDGSDKKRLTDSSSDTLFKW